MNALNYAVEYTVYTAIKSPTSTKGHTHLHKIKGFRYKSSLKEQLGVAQVAESKVVIPPAQVEIPLCDMLALFMSQLLTVDMSLSPEESHLPWVPSLE